MPPLLIAVAGSSMAIIDFVGPNHLLESDPLLDELRFPIPRRIE